MVKATRNTDHSVSQKEDLRNELLANEYLEYPVVPTYTWFVV